MSSIQQALSAEKALNTAAEVKELAKKGQSRVWMANAIPVNPRPFVEARRRLSKKHNEILEHPERLLKTPKEDAHYGWASFSGASKFITVNRAAAGQYRYVQPEELKKDLAAAFEVQKGTTGTTVRHGSLVLVEIPHEAWIECFIEPEIESVARLDSEEENFQAQIEEASQGSARGTVEAVKETETVPVSKPGE